MIKEEQTHFVDPFFIDVFFDQKLNDLVIYLLDGPDTEEQVSITWFITNELTLFANLNLDIFASFVPLVHEKIKSSTKALGYFYA